MGIIQKQSIRSTFVIMLGFGLGAINLLLIAPKVLTPTEIGLTRIITDASITLATMCTLGSLPVIYKFFPFYKSYVPAARNDLPFVTLMICLFGFLIICLCGYAAKDIIVRKYSERSPLFVEYSYLVYPFSFFFLIYMWLEAFSWSLRKGVQSNATKETMPRLLFTFLLIFVGSRLITMHTFLVVFSLSYFLPTIILFLVLRQSGQFMFVPKLSPLTIRLQGKMINFGLFIFGAQFLNLLSKTADTFILASKAEGGLIDAAVFTYATYVVTLMEVPQRSINSISIPVLAELWKEKDLPRISNIYKKSVTNLLIIGLTMFSLIYLNVHNLVAYLGKDYAGIGGVILLMGVGKLIDLATGANGPIISTSNFWRVDFTTNVIYTVIALPLNYILISTYGLMGAAYSGVISLTFYNVMRFSFLWYKFNLQPYTFKDLVAIAFAVVASVLVYYVPRMENIFIDAAARCLLFIALFISSIYFAHISSELNEMVLKYMGKARNMLAGTRQ